MCKNLRNIEYDASHKVLFSLQVLDNEKRTMDRLVPIDMKIKRKFEIPKKEVYLEEEIINEKINFQEWVGKNKIDFVLLPFSLLLIRDDSRKIMIMNSFLCQYCDETLRKFVLPFFAESYFVYKH